MRAPIKLNRSGWPRVLGRILPATNDPRVLSRSGDGMVSAVEFARAVSVLKFGPTFKTTHAGRQPIADRVVAERLAGERPVILDIGASDGSTSLDLIRRLGPAFAHYYVTDYNISVEYALGPNGVVFFRATSGPLLLAVGERFVVYAETRGAPPPVPWLCRRMLACAATVGGWREKKLVQPELEQLAAADSRVTIERYDMMQPWAGTAPDLIKMANVLNAVYFSREQLRAALRCQCTGLREGGFLLLVDNRGSTEQLSLFRRADGAMKLEEARNGGADAAVHVPREVP